MIKSNVLTSLFQKLLNDRDIRTLKSNFFYYLIFRVVRNFLAYDLIIKIYNFRVFGSIRKNETSYFLLKKCEFGDINHPNHPNIIKIDITNTNIDYYPVPNPSPNTTSSNPGHYTDYNYFKT